MTDLNKKIEMEATLNRFLMNNYNIKEENIPLMARPRGLDSLEWLEYILFVEDNFNVRLEEDKLITMYDLYEEVWKQLSEAQNETIKIK